MDLDTLGDDVTLVAARVAAAEARGRLLPLTNRELVVLKALEPGQRATDIAAGASISISKMEAIARYRNAVRTGRTPDPPSVGAAATADGAEQDLGVQADCAARAVALGGPDRPLSEVVAEHSRGGGRWSNVRSGNTEPLLRLDVEARTGEEMALLRDEVLELVRR